MRTILTSPRHSTLRYPRDSQLSGDGDASDTCAASVDCAASGNCAVTVECAELGKGDGTRDCATGDNCVASGCDANVLFHL